MLTGMRTETRGDSVVLDAAALRQQRRLKQAIQFLHKDSADLLPLDGLKKLGTSKQGVCLLVQASYRLLLHVSRLVPQQKYRNITGVWTNDEGDAVSFFIYHCPILYWFHIFNCKPSNKGRCRPYIHNIAISSGGMLVSTLLECTF